MSSGGGDDHPYVEIAGIKWATMNIGAKRKTDYGLYFQWGDTQGYTASQVGTGSYQKPFGWADYKFGNGTSSPAASRMVKYNASDGKTVLDLSDDAARLNWGGYWRMPTIEESQALGAAVNTQWTSNYNGTGVAGVILTDKTDSSKVLFFPAAGNFNGGSVSSVGTLGRCWLGSNTSSILTAYDFGFSEQTMSFKGNASRYMGYNIRPVFDDSTIQ